MVNPDQRAAIGEFITGLNRKFETVREQIEPVLISFAKSMAEIAVNFQRAVEAAAVLYPQLRGAIAPLAKRGWFVSGYFGMSEVVALAQQCGNASNEELDRTVAEMYRTSIDEHAISLLHDYPAREFAIRPAVEAHKRGDYALAVPVFFAQAEGICFAELNRYIFTNGKAKGGVDENIKAAAKERLERVRKPGDAANQFDLLSAFVEIMWLPFAEPLPVGYGATDRRINEYDGLNRNTVMHGLDLDYATEENSLKAFSMLSHVGALMHDLADKPKGCDRGSLQ